MSSLICPAIHYDDKKEYRLQPKNIQTGIVLCGHRHGAILEQFKALGFDVIKSTEYTQGYITKDNTFVNRKQAKDIARLEGIDVSETELLYSESLY